MFVPAKPFISYKHIEAKTPEDLEILMLKISVQAQIPPTFTPPTFANGKWHSFYLFDFSKEIKGLTKIELQTKGKK